jgi:hypothetical protein
MNHGSFVLRPTLAAILVLAMSVVSPAGEMKIYIMTDLEEGTITDVLRLFEF